MCVAVVGGIGTAGRPAGVERAPTTFDAWLAALSARSDRVGDR